MNDFAQFDIGHACAIISIESIFTSISSKHIAYTDGKVGPTPKITDVSRSGSRKIVIFVGTND